MQGGQQVALLRQLLLQRGQGLLHLCQRGFLRHDVAFGDLAEIVLTPQQRKHVGFYLDNARRGRNLAATNPTSTLPAN